MGQRGLSASAPWFTGHSFGSAPTGRFLIAVFDEWVRRDVGRVFVQLFDIALGVWQQYVLFM